jgi:hypothetical protein
MEHAKTDPTMTADRPRGETAREIGRCFEAVDRD